MIVRKHSDIQESAVETPGARNVGIRVLLSREDGAPNFIMRRFSIRPGGHTPYHTHPWEHQVYVLSGSGRVNQGEEHHALSADSVVLVLPDEEHSFENTGDEPLVFLCTIPIV